MSDDLTFCCNKTPLMCRCNDEERERMEDIEEDEESMTDKAQSDKERVLAAYPKAYAIKSTSYGNKWMVTVPSHGRIAGGRLSDYCESNELAWASAASRLPSSPQPDMPDCSLCGERHAAHGQITGRCPRIPPKWTYPGTKYASSPQQGEPEIPAVDDFTHDADCPCFSEDHSKDCANCECEQTCDLPPDGWTCNRRRGHGGPCAALPQQPPQEWEAFCDASYFDMWAVRPIGENRWGHCFHLPSRDEAEGLRSILNKSSSIPATSDVAKAMLNALYEILPYLNELRTEAYHRLAPIAHAAVKLAEENPAAAQTFDEPPKQLVSDAYLGEEIGKQDIFHGQRLIAIELQQWRQWNAARGGR